MKLLKYILAFLPSLLCQAVEHSFTETHPTREPLRAEENVTMLPETTRRNLYVHHLAGRCNWTLRMSGSGSSNAVPLTAEYTDLLIEHICQETGCGSVYTVDKNSSLQNTTCFHGCSYEDQRLQNCSESVRSGCVVINAAVCGNQAVRLSGGSDRCAGRVELWRDGRWGTVCDDHWDLRDAAVVCAQLGCGYALSVTGQGGAFPAGRGPVHRDDLNCTGREENLWACPASQDEPDCGHKEDAGVVCSEMRSVRLSGGLDRCSGKVEIHRNGSWGTICDNCWNANMAALVCSMLQCGPEPLNYSQFLPPLTHNNGPLYYYDCGHRDRSLWQCLEFINSRNLCATSKASGVICNGSLGLRSATTPTAEEITSWTTVGTTLMPAAKDAFLLNPELLITVSVSLLLLVLLITNTVLCCHYRRRHAFLLQQTRFSGKSSSDSGNHQNYYKDPVNLIKISSNSQEADGPTNPRFLWSQISSADSASVDTDYEQYDPSNDPSVSLSTFRNSQRYRTDTVYPLVRPSALDCLSEEDGEPLNKGTAASGRHDGGAAAPQQARESMISVDSFETSSTSSEECYENVTNGYVTPDPGPGQSSQSQSQEKLQFERAADLQSSDEEDDDHLYSPVSPE